jgi:hypothetical protein
MLDSKIDGPGIDGTVRAADGLKAKQNTCTASTGNLPVRLTAAFCLEWEPELLFAFI